MELPSLRWFNLILAGEWNKKLDEAAEWEANLIRSWVDNLWTLHEDLYHDLHFILTLWSQMDESTATADPRPGFLGNHLRLIGHYEILLLEMGQPLCGYRTQLPIVVAELHKALREFDKWGYQSGREMWARANGLDNVPQFEARKTHISYDAILMKIHSACEELRLLKVLATLKFPNRQVVYPKVHNIDLPMLKAAYGAVIRKGAVTTETLTSRSLDGDRSASLLQLRVLAEFGLYNGHKKTASPDIREKVNEVIATLQLTKESITGKS